MTNPYPLDINQLDTPCCLIDVQKMRQNIARLANRMSQLGCVIRPHVKTNKSTEVTRAIIEGGNTQGITVSTLKEAEHFFAQGYTDILYAVGIVPNKLTRVASLIEAGCNLTVVLDNAEMADMVIDTCASLTCTVPVMIEIDTDGHRAGIEPHSDALITTGQSLSNAANITLSGVMAHAGESYGCFTEQEKIAIAQQERDLTVLAAKRLRGAGLACPNVSIGSTPTAFFIDHLDGVTEVRAGVYVFFDLVMAGLGVCEQQDIALSVLTSVIGHQADKHWVLTDAGWMALSRDRGTADHPKDYGYGLVTDISGQIKGNTLVQDVNQEHGIIGSSAGEPALDTRAFPLASLLRILPNHACATAAQFDHYYAVDDGQVVAKWPVLRGW